MIPSSLPTLEEEELLLKKEALSQLLHNLTERELLLSTLKSELHLFKNQYILVIGAKYAELDYFRAQVLEFAATFDPYREDLKFEAESAREYARNISEQTGWSRYEELKEEKQDFTPTENLKKLFREAAKKVHPDLTNQAKECDRRHHLMAELNNAYENLDENRIIEIIEKCGSEADIEDKSSIGLQLVQCFQGTARIKERLKEIGEKLEELKDSEIYRLKERIERENLKGRDIMYEMALEIDDKIAKVKEWIRHMVDELTYL